ncbi:MAG: PAS domain S-box protein [Mariprofundaceae bacterium]|nr:PAS domain S-box protein [Mariprofundaceae bacterium]
MNRSEPLQAEISDYHWLFQNSPLATKIIDLNGMSVDYNKAYFDLIGHAEIVLNRFHPSAISPEKQPDGQASFGKANEMIRLVKEKGRHVFEWLYQVSDRGEFLATVELDLFQFSDSPCIRVVVNNNAEKAKTQKQLIETEGNLKILAKAIEQSMDSIIITDRHGTILFINPAFTRITGYTAEEAIGQNPSILKSGVQGQAFYESMWKDLRQGKPWNARLVDRRKNGEFYPADLTITPIKDNAGEIVNFVGIKRDITQHEALENKFRQAQKMEAIGTMVGGIAHDFKQVGYISQVLF